MSIDLATILPRNPGSWLPEESMVRDGLEVATDGRWIAFRPTADPDRGPSVPGAIERYAPLARDAAVAPVVIPAAEPTPCATCSGTGRIDEEAGDCDACVGGLRWGPPVEILGRLIDGAVAARLRDLGAEVGATTFRAAGATGYPHRPDVPGRGRERHRHADEVLRRKGFL